MKKLLTLACLVLPLFCSCASTKQASNSVIELADVISMMDYCPRMPLETAESDADLFMANAVKMFVPKGFTQGLTGEGYGGPCVIIDGFYKGGYGDSEQYCFIPTDKAHACVMEIASCNDGDEGDYEVTVTVTLFAKKVVEQFMSQFGKLGFKLISQSDNGEARSYSNGHYVIDYNHFVIDYSQEVDNDNECHFFMIQTTERKASLSSEY
ncbi:MAG: hypothetical protein J5565_02790 [Muribaculaceae bacterium]|nr:hypothetical protein [Muribaculaceae bacterium]